MIKILDILKIDTYCYQTLSVWSILFFRGGLGFYRDGISGSSMLICACLVRITSALPDRNDLYIINLIEKIINDNS